MILAAAGSEEAPEIAQAALAQLCQTYWDPLYSFVRSRGHTVHDAQDLTQSFFAYLIERRIYARADQQKGRFRSFLLASMKNFLADSYDRERTLKRGGMRDFVPLDERQIREAESLFRTYGDFTEATDGDRLFERSWAETLVASVLEQMAEAYKTEGKNRLFEELKIFLTVGADPLPTYDQLAIRLNAPASTLRSHVTRLRARYREALRAEARRTVNSDADVDRELRELLRVLTEC